MSTQQNILTTDINDANPDNVRQIMLPFQDFGGNKIFAGKVRTAVTMEDTGLIQQQLYNTQGNGGVIVVDGGGSFRSALIGGNYAQMLADNGWAGIVINGVIRDADDIANTDLGVKALGTTPVRSAKTGIGALDVPVAFGNVLIQTGQYIYCDKDGALISDQPLTFKVSE